MTHAGLLAQNIDGAARCFVAYGREGARRLGGHTYPDVTLDYIGFGHTLAAARKGDREGVRALLSHSVSQLQGAGADFFVCADNTAHLALDQPGPEVALPALHLGQLVAEAASREGFRRVGVLGTQLLAGSPFYPTWFGLFQILAERPDAADLETVDKIIFSELVDGVIRHSSRQRCVEIIDRLAARGCDAVALVSTELPSLIGPQDSPLPVLDSARIAALGALDVALGDRPMPTWRGGPHPDLLTAAG